MAALRVRRREERDLPEVERFLAERHSPSVIRLGRREDGVAHPAPVDDSCARLKAEIPRTGEHGIDLRDELVLEKDLDT